ncbi:MAG: translation initiation factor IF-2 [Candidatus Omnitrophica bacterium]|nr:translation initiation factor IF-2 [Candidatus Omnitrophota bacterium]
MHIVDLAKELKITEVFILEKLKALKLRAKDGKEITPGVEMILRDALADEGIGTRVVEEEEAPKKAVKKPKAAAAAKPKAAAQKTDKPKSPSGAKAAGKVTKKPAVVEKIIEAKSGPLPKAVEPPKPAVAAQKQPVAPAIKPAPAADHAKGGAPSAPRDQPKPEARVEPPKIDVSKIVLPAEPLPFEPVKKKVRFDQPFVTVKPLVKKRRRGEGDSGSFHRENRPSPTAAAMAGAGPSLAQGPLQDIEIPVPITVKDFAVRVNQKMNAVLKRLLDMGIFANINQNLGEELVQKLAASFGVNVLKTKSQEEQWVDLHQQEKDDPALLKPRAPVVTFMGHVDHGKTSLLDRIRCARVAQGEHGGITQHIGAYSVRMPAGTITFLDTPGHAAFTAMRARGAHITDMVVLVVAADEGIMPQTEEAIDHARAANVPIVVALNKIDKKTADPDRVKKQLAEHDLLPEDWSGKVGVVGVSALTGDGIDALLDRILLEAEVLELKANASKKASGIVIEAHLSKGRGAIASLIVQSGTLKEGDAIVVGPYAGKVKALFDDHERPIKEAGPSAPVEILGLSEVPAAGEMFYVVADDKTARAIALVRQEKIKNTKLSGSARVSLEELYAQIQEGHIKELRVVIKGDVQGSIEAIKEELSKIPTNEVKLKFMHTAAGDVNASDVILAMASQAIISAFNVDIDAKARAELEKTPVDVRRYRIIYDAVEDVRKALEGLLAPKLKRHFVGRVEIRNVLKLSKSGIVAGCYVQKGKIRNKAQVEVLRNGEVAHAGHISSLKRFKDDVKEVAEGFECGITISNFDQIQVGDIIEAFDIESIARKL